MVEIPKLYNTAEASKLLGVTCGTLAVWRCTRRKPLRFVRMGRKIFYADEAIREFIVASSDPGDGEKPKRFAKRKAAR
jgi:hypothetical protein